MPATSLAYIDDTVDRLLDKEFLTPTPHKDDFLRAHKPRMIAGFEVRDEGQTKRLIEEARERRMATVKTYRVEQSAMKELISDAGVKPLAVLPTVMFERICAESNLYFVPKSMRTEVNVQHFLAWLANITIDSSAWTGARSPRQVRKARGKTVEGYMEEFSRDEVVENLLAPVNQVALDTVATKLLTEAFVINDDVRAAMRAQNRSFTVQSSRVDGQKYELLLPLPPEDVCKILVKLYDSGFDLKTVAVYGAVDFVGGVEPIFRRAMNDQRAREEREQARIDWMLNDPIVYVTRGSVTAVVAQFGPFPVEQAIVDRIQASEFLPLVPAPNFGA